MVCDIQASTTLIQQYSVLKCNLAAPSKTSHYAFYSAVLIMKLSQFMAQHAALAFHGSRGHFFSCFFLGCNESCNDRNGFCAWWTRSENSSSQLCNNPVFHGPPARKPVRSRILRSSDSFATPLFEVQRASANRSSAYCPALATLEAASQDLSGDPTVNWWTTSR